MSFIDGVHLLLCGYYLDDLDDLDDYAGKFKKGLLGDNVVILLLSFRLVNFVVGEPSSEFYVLVRVAF